MWWSDPSPRDTAARWLRVAAAGLLAGGIALAGGCGFRPLYGDGALKDAAPELARISVAPIPERMGQILRNHLIDGLSPGFSEPASPAWRLDVRIENVKEGLGILEDESITRYNLRVTATYALVDLATEQVRQHGKVRSIASYNVVDSPYATLVAERDAESRAAREAAEEIRLRLALFLGTRN